MRAQTRAINNGRIFCCLELSRRPRPRCSLVRFSRERFSGSFWLFCTRPLGWLVRTSWQVSHHFGGVFLVILMRKVVALLQINLRHLGVEQVSYSLGSVPVIALAQVKQRTVKPGSLLFSLLLCWHILTNPSCWCMGERLSLQDLWFSDFIAGKHGSRAVSQKPLLIYCSFQFQMSFG